MKITKELEGKEVYLVPWGNYARWKVESEIRVIDKVARVFITIDGEKLRKNDTNGTLISNDDCNSGYYLYASKEDHEERLRKKENVQVIMDYLNVASDITLDDTLEIKTILGIE